MNKTIPAYEAVIAMHNPTSTSHKRILDEVNSLDSRVIMVQTHSDIRYTRDNLLARLEPGFVVLGLGGDGTANQLGNIMLQSEIKEQGLSDVPFVPLRGGNANDIARSYNGNHSVRTILQKGSRVPMRPLAVEVVTPDHVKNTRYALGYFSVGAAARAAGALEDIKTKSRLMQYGPQQIREIVTTLGTVAHSPEFSIEDENTDNVYVSDISFVRGRYIAKHGKLAASVAIHAYERVITPYAGYTGTTLNMLRLGTGRLLGTMLHQPTSIRVSSIDGVPLPLQYDGETHMFIGEAAVAPTGSKIKIGLSEQAFTTLFAN